MKDVNFDPVAGVYDRLARFVFGMELRRAQACFLDFIANDANVLIVGGGTGDILIDLYHRKKACSVHYLETSRRMAQRARIKSPFPTIVFEEREDCELPPAHYHVVLTNFFLDIYRQDTIGEVIGRLKKCMRPGGLWIATDFVPGRTRWQRFLLRIMYVFFRRVCGIEARKLPNWRNALGDAGLRPLAVGSFCASFVESRIWMNPQT